MTSTHLSPRRAMLAQAAALADQLQRELSLPPDRAAALALALYEDPRVLKLDSLERLIDVLKAEVLSLARLVDRHAFVEEFNRPRGYRQPKVPAYFSALVEPENPALSTAQQVQSNLEGALHVLDVTCAVYLLRVGAGSLISPGAPRPLLLLNGEEPVAWVLLPELVSDKDAKALCERLARHVRKFDGNEFRQRLYLSELVREGFRVLSTDLASFDISRAG